MVAYNFQARFAGAVESGEKRQTIRKAGKRRPPREGEQLQLYTGMRTKSCRLLKLGVCTKVTPIKIRPGHHQVLVERDPGGQWHDYGYCYQVVNSRCDTCLAALAFLDGFDSTADFFAFFAKQSDGGEFCGHLVQWVPEEATRSWELAL